MPTASPRPLMTTSTRGPWWRRQHAGHLAWPRARRWNPQQTEEPPLRQLLRLCQKLQVRGIILECRYCRLWCKVRAASSSFALWLSFRAVCVHRKHKHLDPWHAEQDKVWPEGESLKAAQLQAPHRYTSAIPVSALQSTDQTRQCRFLKTKKQKPSQVNWSRLESPRRICQSTTCLSPPLHIRKCTNSSASRLCRSRQLASQTAAQVEPSQSLWFYFSIGRWGGNNRWWAGSRRSRICSAPEEASSWCKEKFCRFWLFSSQCKYFHGCRRCVSFGF